MPWKWLDPGVNLEYVGRKTVDGQEYDVVTLSFGSGVGLTSNDRYWAYVSTTTNLMERWEYVLETEEGAPGSGAPTVWAWESWKDTAGVKLSTVRRRIGEGPASQITFPLVDMRAEVPAAELQRSPPREALRRRRPAPVPRRPAPSPTPAPGATPSAASSRMP